jgi:hypothetical protein
MSAHRIGQAHRNFGFEGSMGMIGIEWVNKFHGRASDLKNNDHSAQGFY